MIHPYRRSARIDEATLEKSRSVPDWLDVPLMFGTIFVCYVLLFVIGFLLEAFIFWGDRAIVDPGQFFIAAKLGYVIISIGVGVYTTK